MLEDNSFLGSNLLQPWLDTSDPPSCKSNIILSSLSGASCGNNSFGTFSVTDSEAGPFATHPNDHGLWYEENQCIIRDPIGAY